MILEKKNLTVSMTGTLPRVPFLAIKEKILGKNFDLSIAASTPAKIKVLNKKYRQKNYVPNVLSFLLDKSHGEVLLCLPVIKKEHKKFNMTYEKYLTYLLIHSMLHLKGYTHGSTMEAKERQILKLFS